MLRDIRLIVLTCTVIVLYIVDSDLNVSKEYTGIWILMLINNLLSNMTLIM